jgi:hypothetical protein
MKDGVAIEIPLSGGMTAIIQTESLSDACRVLEEMGYMPPPSFRVNASPPGTYLPEDYGYEYFTGTNGGGGGDNNSS